VVKTGKAVICVVKTGKAVICVVKTEKAMKARARNGRQNFALRSNFHVIARVVYHAANLRHGTHGFSSPPKEGMLRIFTPEKIGFGRV
jgi:hypothetical protein